MKKRDLVLVVLRLTLVSVGLSCITTSRAGENVAQGNGSYVTTIAPGGDCFAVSSGSPSTEVRLVGPREVKWDRRSQKAADILMEIENVGRVGWLINGRGAANVSPFPGHDEFKLRIAKRNGDPWVTYADPGTHEMDGVLPRRTDYVDLKAGAQVRVTLQLSAATYPLPAGAYTISVCYWDRYAEAQKWFERSIFSGPIVGPPIQLSVVE